jgi:hypothetical protein
MFLEPPVLGFQPPTIVRVIFRPPSPVLCAFQHRNSSEKDPPKVALQPLFTKP